MTQLNNESLIYIIFNLNKKQIKKIISKDKQLIEDYNNEGFRGIKVLPNLF